MCLASSKSPLDCSFDHLSNSQDSGFCQWQPFFSAEQESSNGAQLWHTGNAVLVDSANSVVRSTSQPFSYPFKSKNGGAIHNNRFAYVQGQSAKGPTEGAIQSPLLEVEDRIVEYQDLKFSYWKANASPTLDICIKNNVDDELNCIDSIQGPGQQQWIRRTVELPLNKLPFRVVFRARNVVSAEDIVCIDDVQLVTSLKGVSHRDFRKSRDDQFVEGYLRQEEESGADFSQEPVSLMKMNKFGMQPSPITGAEIRPPLPVFSPSKMTTMPEKRVNMMSSNPSTLPIINPLSRMNALPFAQSKNTPNSSMFVKPRNINNNTPFLEFPSFSEGLHQTSNEKPQVTESTPFCRAIKCSFLENTCLWKLGPTWKHSDGNIAKDTAGEDSVTSAQFKAPLASFLEFDLWMSDDSHLMVLEELDAVHEEDEEVMLFSRRGMANNGWHRFRVPLRPSYRPIQVKFRNILPTKAFITLSNTRLVNGDGEELACETVFQNEKEENPLDPGKESAPLLGNPWQNHLQRQQPQNGFAFAPTMDNRPTLISTLPTLPPPLFNPFKPMFEDGIAPIVPLRDDPQRLTAFQRAKLAKESLTALLPSNEEEQEQFSDSTTTLPSPVSSSTNQAAAFHQHFTTLMPTIFGEKLLEGVPPIEELASNLNSPANNIFRLRDLKSPEASTKTKGKTLGELIGIVAGQPVLEQQLRLLAQHLGFDANSTPDARTLETLKRFLGTRFLPGKGLLSQLNLPASVTSTIGQNGSVAAVSPRSALPPRSPFEAPGSQMLPMVMDGRTSLARISPIQPANEDGLKVDKEESVKSGVSSSMSSSNQPINAYLLNHLANIVSPPSTPIDPQSPLARENLDFVFQNALNA